MVHLGTDVVLVFGGVAVTNTMLTGSLVALLLIAAAGTLRLYLDMWPSRAQVGAELFLETWQNLADSAGGVRARRFVPSSVQPSSLFCLRIGSGHCPPIS